MCETHLENRENLCEEMHIKEGGIVVNSLGTLLKKLAVILAASSHRITLEILMCVCVK